MLGLSYTALARWDEMKHGVLKCHLGQIPVAFERERERYIYTHLEKHLLAKTRRKMAKRKPKMAKMKHKMAKMRRKRFMTKGQYFL